jgi:biotin carboxyl carrier protein
VNEPTLLARIEPDPDGGVRVLAPSVGYWSDPPRPGSLLVPGNSIGTLQRLRVRFRLVLPDGATGRVDGSVTRHGRVALEYGEILFRLQPVTATAAGVGERAGAGAMPGADLPVGGIAVVSPTDGVFYRRPSPDAAPFVEVGDRIVRGTPVGLVEVMKTFNQIRFGGADAPEQAEVVEVRCEDAQEVSAGQVLVVLR